jgi:hypothetical protein
VEVTGSDRTLAVGAPTCPVSGCGTGARSDRTRRCLCPIKLMYADAMAQGAAVACGSRKVTRRWVSVRLRST